MKTLRTSPVARGLWPVACLAALTMAATGAGAQDRQSDRDFRWDGPLASGRSVYIRNLNGPVRVERASGGRLEVTAVKRWRRGDPADAKIEVTRVASGDQDVLVCAIWRDVTDQCDERGYRTFSNRGRSRWDRDDDVTVELTVRVPEGVKVDVSTVNGGVDVDGATSVVEAHTVNGGVTARSTGGPVRASTVNGDIEVRMGALGDGDLEFSTINGSVEVTVPGELNAEVTMRTVTGSVGSDFPMTVNGRVNPRRLTATIGRGGRRIEMTTTNGSIELRKG